MAKAIGFGILGVVLLGLLVAMHQSTFGREGDTFAPGAAVAAVPDVRLVTVSGEVSKPHVLFVDVGEAVPVQILTQAMQTVRAQVHVNMRLAALDKLDAAHLVSSWDVYQRAGGEQACVTVFVVNDPQGVSFLSRPGFWALVNTRSLRYQEPSEEVYRTRVAKLLMKGLAHAVGVGATHDEWCVLYYKSFALDGFDATSATYSPFAYFVLSETLIKIGGAKLAYESDNE